MGAVPQTTADLPQRTSRQPWDHKVTFAYRGERRLVRSGLAPIPLAAQSKTDLLNRRRHRAFLGDWIKLRWSTCAQGLISFHALGDERSVRLMEDQFIDPRFAAKFDGETR